VMILTQPPMTAVPPRVNWRLAGHVPPLASPAPRVRFVEMASSQGPSLVMTALRLTILDVWLTVQAPSLAGPALEAALLLPPSVNSAPTARRRVLRPVTMGQMTVKDVQWAVLEIPLVGPALILMAAILHVCLFAGTEESFLQKFVMTDLKALLFK